MIYTSLKNNIYYDSNADVLNYKIVEDGGAVIYFGNSIKNPKSGLNRINVGEIIRDYLTNNLEEGWPALSGSSISQTEAYKKFSLISGELVMETYGVIFNWTDLFDGGDMVLSEPINGKMEPRMKFFWTAFLKDAEIVTESGSTIFVLNISGETNYSYSAQTSFLSVVECTDWNGIEIQTDSDWFTATKTNTGIAISIDENTNISYRAGSINYLYSGTPFYSTIIEQQGHFILVVSGTTDFDYNEQSSTLSVIECSDWPGVVVSTDSDWITYTKNNTGITVSLSENTGEEKRNGIIFFSYNNNIVGSVSLEQKQNYIYCYFTTKARNDGTIGLKGTRNTSYQYRKDNGDWINITARTTPTYLSVESGDSIEWKSKKVGVNCNDIRFEGTADFNAEGNIMSLAFGDSFKEYNSLSGTSSGGTSVSFGSVFSGNTHIVSAKNLVLAAETLSMGCYSNMFEGCERLVEPPVILAATMAHQSCMDMFYKCFSLTYAPQLNATSLASSCYSGMFQRCTSLVSMPELPATVLEPSCYLNMFNRCTSLVNVYNLPATILRGSCYQNMFYECTSLIIPPQISATTLYTSCCANMFMNCTSLIESPVLKASALTDECYYQMFTNCSSLRYVKCLAKDFGYSTNDSTTDWLANTPTSGTRTFVKKRGVSWPSGSSGIPNGWTVQEADS